MATVAINGKNGFSRSSSIFLTAFIAVILFFFTVLMAAGTRMKIAASCYWLFIVILFYLTIKTGRISTYRRIFFIAIAVLFAPAFIAILLETRGSMSLSAADVFKNDTPFCQIVIPMTILPYVIGKVLIFPARLNNHFASVYSMLVIWLVSSFTLGRGWCGWTCFYGGWDELFSGVSRKPKITIDPKNDTYRYFSFVILGFVVLASLATFTAVYCAWLCPFKTLTEYGEIVNIRTYIQTMVFILFFFGLVVVLPLLTKKRVQCTAFCPFGAFQALIDKLSLYRVRIDKEKCTACGRCMQVCRLNAINASVIEGNGKALLTCVKCGECVEKCPNGALEYRFALAPWKYYRQSSPRKGFSRFTGEILSPRALLIFSGFLFGAVIGGGFGVGTLDRLLNLFTTGSFLLK